MGTALGEPPEQHLGIMVEPSEVGHRHTLGAGAEGSGQFDDSSAVGASVGVLTVDADTTVTAIFPGAPTSVALSILHAGNGVGTVMCSTDGGARTSVRAQDSNPNGTI